MGGVRAIHWWVVYTLGRAVRCSSIFASLSPCSSAHCVLVTVSSPVFLFTQISAARPPCKRKRFLKTCDGPRGTSRFQPRWGIRHRVEGGEGGHIFPRDRPQSRLRRVERKGQRSCSVFPGSLTLPPPGVSRPDRTGWGEIRLLVPLRSHMISANICQV